MQTVNASSRVEDFKRSAKNGASDTFQAAKTAGRAAADFGGAVMRSKAVDDLTTSTVKGFGYACGALAAIILASG